MADRTVGLSSDAVLPDELRTESSLILRFPREIEHLLTRPHELFRRAMTFQAPLHGHGLVLEGQLHLVDAAMTGDAADPFTDVNAVVEVNEVGEVVDPRPYYRLA